VVLRSSDLVGEGRAPVPHGASAAVGEAVRTASQLAFTSGMHTAFLLSAALIALAAPLGLLLGTGAAGKARQSERERNSARTGRATVGGNPVGPAADLGADAR
jgi:hypothetical protein